MAGCSTMEAEEAEEWEEEEEGGMAIENVVGSDRNHNGTRLEFF